MIRKASKRRHGGSPGRRVENRLADDWPIYLAFLPAVVASAAIGITAAIALGTASPWHLSTADAADVNATAAADDYVEGLARLGIATIADRIERTLTGPPRTTLVDVKLVTRRSTAPPSNES